MRIRVITSILVYYYLNNISFVLLQSRYLDKHNELREKIRMLHGKQGM